MPDIIRYGVALDSRQLERGVDRSNRKLRQLDGNAKRTNKTFRGLSSTAKALGGLFAAIGAARLTKDLFNTALAAEETASKFNTVFGTMAETVDRFNNSFGIMAGLSRTAGRDMIATTGAIAQGMGFAQRASADFAVAVTRLAGDIASFNNLPTADVQHRINAALTGERESLKRLGIVILETDVQRRALNNTGKESVRLLTQQEKATATLQLITERAGVAVGDLARTQESAANQARRLRAELETMKEDISVGLLPVWREFLAVTRDTVEFWGDWLGLRPFAPQNAAWTSDIDAVRGRIAATGEEIARLNQVVDAGERGWLRFGERYTPEARAAQGAIAELNRQLQVQVDLLARLTTAGDDAGDALDDLASDTDELSQKLELSEGAMRKFVAQMGDMLSRKAEPFLVDVGIDKPDDAAKDLSAISRQHEEAALRARMAWESSTSGMQFALERFMVSGEVGFAHLIDTMIMELQRLAAAAAATQFFETLAGSFGIPGIAPAKQPAKLKNIPEFQSGGVVPGPIGSAQLAVVHGGEMITPAQRPITVQHTVNVNINNPIDAPGMTAWWSAYKGEIVRLVAEGASESEGFRKMLQRG